MTFHIDRKQVNEHELVTVTWDCGLHAGEGKKGIFHHVVALDGEIVGNRHPFAKDGGISVFKEEVSLPEDIIKKSLKQLYAARKR